MTYLSTLICLILNYSNPNMLKKETPKYTDKKLHILEN